MSSSATLLTNALSYTNQLLTALLTDPTITAAQKDLIKERLKLNTVAIDIAKIQGGTHA